MVSFTTLPSTFAILDRQRAVLEAVLSKDAYSEGSSQWKVLVCDTEGRAIIETLFSPTELRSFGVTLNTIIDAPRGPVPNTHALYLVNSSPQNVAWVTKDLSSKESFYDSSSIGFLTSVSPSLLSALAAQMPVPSPLTTVHDLHSHFISLEQNLFSLNMYNSYTHIVHAEQMESKMQYIVDRIVGSLFSVLITLGIIPIIRAQRGGPAQVVAAKLDAKIRDNLHLFQRAPLSSKALAFRRPLLLLVDRSLDFNPIFYHTWTYQALIHDCLDMKLNRVIVNVASANSDETDTSKTYVLNKKEDLFWESNASSPFPVVAEAVEIAMKKYRENIESINKRSLNSSGEATDQLNSSMETSRLADAISSLPELSRQKETINTHTNIATTILNNINKRSLDTFFELESQLMSEINRPVASQSPDAYKAAITKLLRSGIDEDSTESTKKQGPAADRLRMFLIYYDVFGDRFSAADMSEYKQLIKAAGADVSIIDYFAKLKGYRHEELALPSPSDGSLNTKTLTRLMNRMVHRGYRSITNVAQNAKKLVTEQSASFAVARTLEIFMKESSRDRNPSLTSDVLNNFLLFDPKVLPSGDSLRQVADPSSEITQSLNPVRKTMQEMVFNDAIVFTIGGGNYVEFENCVDAISGGASSGESPNLLYGTTEMMTAESFLSQLGQLAKESKSEGS